MSETRSIDILFMRDYIRGLHASDVQCLWNYYSRHHSPNRFEDASQEDRYWILAYWLNNGAGKQYSANMDRLWTMARKAGAVADAVASTASTAASAAYNTVTASAANWFPEYFQINYNKPLPVTDIDPVDMDMMERGLKFIPVGTLGKGGFGRTHICKDSKGSKYAVKLMDKIQRGRLMLDAFNHEVGILNYVKTVPELCDIGTCIHSSYRYNPADPDNPNHPDPTIFAIVITYIEGSTLDKYIKTGHIHREEGAERKLISSQNKYELINSLVDVFRTLHSHQIVHRDIKPANLMVVEIDDKPQVRIIDYGLGCITTASNTLSCSVRRGGTAVYEAPESRLRKPGVTDYFKFDAYSIGCIIYEIISDGNRLIDSPPDYSYRHEEVITAKLDQIRWNASDWEMNRLRSLIKRLTEFESVYRGNLDYAANILIRHDYEIMSEIRRIGEIPKITGLDQDRSLLPPMENYIISKAASNARQSEVADESVSTRDSQIPDMEGFDEDILVRPRDQARSKDSDGFVLM